MRAQILRDAPAVTLPAGILDDLAPEKADTSSARSRSRWRKADVERAIAAAERAGLRGYRIEIAPDGTVTIVVGEPLERPDAADPA